MTSVRPTGQLILAVDDEPFVLRAVTTALAVEGLGVIVAENGAAGLEAFLRAPEQFDLVLADVVMPLMTGLDMAKRIKAIRPELPIVLMTAYSDAVIETLGDIRLPLIRKPFLPDELVRAVRANLHPPRAGA